MRAIHGFLSLLLSGACSTGGPTGSDPSGGNQNAAGPDARQAPRNDAGGGAPAYVDGGSGPVPNNCGTVTEGGQCVGMVLSFCEGGLIEVVDCATYMLPCECDSSGYCDCAGGETSDLDGGVPPAGDCGEVTEGGECFGEELEYCEDGSLVTVDCAAVGATCQCDTTGWCDCF